MFLLHYTPGHPQSAIFESSPDLPPPKKEKAAYMRPQITAWVKEKHGGALMAKILIVEDNILKRDVLKMLLAPEGHTLTLAADGEEGLALARTNHPDLIVADLIMPRMDGYEFCKAIRDDPTLSRIPIVINSVLDYEKVQLLAHACDVHYFIPPVAKKKDILDIVHAALEKRPSTDVMNTDAIVARLEDVIAELKALSAKLPPSS